MKLSTTVTSARLSYKALTGDDQYFRVIAMLARAFANSKNTQIRLFSRKVIRAGPASTSRSVNLVRLLCLVKTKSNLRAILYR